MIQIVQNNYTKEILTLLRKFSDPQQISQAGHLAKGLRTPQRIRLWWTLGIDYGTYTGLGIQNLGGHKQNLVCTGTQEKGAVTPQETDPDLPVSVQEFKM